MVRFLDKTAPVIGTYFTGEHRLRLCLHYLRLEEVIETSYRVRRCDTNVVLTVIAGYVQGFHPVDDIPYILIGHRTRRSRRGGSAGAEGRGRCIRDRGLVIRCLELRRSSRVEDFRHIVPENFLDDVVDRYFRERLRFQRKGYSVTILRYGKGSLRYRVVAFGDSRCFVQRPALSRYV